MWLFALFLAVPLIEIALFIQVGGAIGLPWTLLIVVLTAILGTLLVKSQGAQAIDRLRRSFNELRDPVEPLAHGAMILFSGALLLTPGFFTDAVGFAFLIPAVRSAVFRYLQSRVKVTHFEYGEPPRHPNDPDIINGEFTEIDPETRPPRDEPSGWTRH